MNWPKLPNRKPLLEKGYTSVQMREYAEKCVKQAIATEKSSATQEPVAWYRLEDEERIYYMTKAWDDCLPLYEHPPTKTTQEPVAEKVYDPEDDTAYIQYFIPHELIPVGTKFYTHPQPKAEQEPKLMLEKFREMEALLDEDSQPQQKTLSNEDLKIIMETTMPVIDWKARHGVELNNGERNKWMLEWFMAFARAIEAAHGIKEQA